MDFGQYTKEEVFGRLKASMRYDGKFHSCSRCGKKTKAGLIFGKVICVSCWDKQTKIGI